MQQSLRQYDYMLQTETENSIVILPNSDYYSAKNRPKSSFNVILDSRNEHLLITIHYG